MPRLATLLLLFAATGSAAGQCTGPACRLPATFADAPRAVQPRASALPAVATVSVAVNRVRSNGTGTLVARNDDYGMVVSCAHLFRDGVGEIVVHFPDGTSCGGKLLEYDSGSDLSAILIYAPPIEPIRIAEQLPRPRDPVRFVGYGPGNQTTRRGAVIAYRASGGNATDLIEISGQAIGGDSGGPILDASGELCGVLFGSDGRRVVGAHCGRIRAFLARHPLPTRSAQEAEAQRESQPAQAETALAWQEPFAALATEHARLAKLIEAQQTATNGRFAQLESMQAPACPCDHSGLASKSELGQVAEHVKKLAAAVHTAAATTTELDDASPPAAWAESIRDTVKGGVEQYIARRLTVLLVGIGAPGWIAAILLYLFRRRLHAQGNTVAARVNADVAATQSTATQSTAKTVVVHSQSPPPPQVIERARSFVEVQVPSARLTAIEWAMDEYVKRNPGARPTVETIEAFAAQYQSGMKPGKE